MRDHRRVKRSYVAQILKVVPYSAIQLCTYEAAKRALRDKEGNLSIPARLAAGALAGMTATLVRHCSFKAVIDMPWSTLIHVYRNLESTLGHGFWVLHIPKRLRMDTCIACKLECARYIEEHKVAASIQQLMSWMLKMNLDGCSWW